MVQDLQDELIPYLVYYLLALLIVFLVRVFVHAMTLGDHARESQASRLSIPLRQQLVTILLQPWAPGHRGALALHFLGAGLASGVNLWWVHTVAYEQWPHFLGYTPGKYDWVLQGIRPLTVWYCSLLLLLFAGGLLIWRGTPVTRSTPQ